MTQSNSERRYDPDFKDLIPMLPTVADFSTVEKVQEARAARYDMFLKPPPPREDVSIEDRMVPGPEGAAEVAIRIYRPTLDAGTPLPCVFEIHGGGFMTGSIEMMDPWCQRVSAKVGAVVVSVEYRLAPEHPFPAALDDALCVYRHLLASGYEARHIALAGDSAGGGLVFSLLLKAAEQDLPRPACVVAFSPWTDMTMTRGSLRHNARRDMMLPVRRFREVVSLYLQGAMTTDPLASPVYGAYDGGESGGPPPALITASKSEILRDDAVAMADRLRDAGGDVALELWKDMPHAWPLFAGMVREADQTVERAGRFIARHLAQGDGD